MINTVIATALAVTLASGVDNGINTTQISGDEFAATTPWYTMQTAGSGSYIRGDGGQYIHPYSMVYTGGIADLWAFTGDSTTGYTIHSRRGTSQQLASPLQMKGFEGSESYVVMTKPGNEAYSYKWDLIPAGILSDKPVYYLAQHGNLERKLTLRDGKLALGTGTPLELLVSNETFDVTAATGKVIGKGKKAAWVSSQSNPRLVLNSPTGTVKAVGQQLALIGKKGTTFELTLENARQDMAIDRLDMQDQGKAFSAKCADGKATITLDADATDKNPLIINKLTVGASYRDALLTGTEVMNSLPDTIPYRIPAIATVAEGKHKGRLIAVADYRYNHADIGVGEGPIDLRISISDDNGKTWSEPKPMMGKDGKPVSRGTGGEKKFDYAFGDPAIVADHNSSRVMIMSCAGTAGFWGGRRAKPQEVAQWWSEDGGDTWTPAHNSTETIYSLFDGTTPWGYIDSMFFGSGRIMQSRNIKKNNDYRLYAVLSAYIEKAGWNPKNYVLYSDDFGKSWHVLGDTMNPPVPNRGDEPKAEELPDGSVLLAARGFSGGRNYNIFKYADADSATGEWGTVVNTNLNNPNQINACNGEILIIPVKNNETGKEAYMAIQTYPFGPGRTNVGLSWKILDQLSDFDTPGNFAKNWDGRYQLSNLSSCYTTMTQQTDKTIGFLYEEDRYQGPGGYSIIYKNLPVEEITQGQWRAISDDDHSLARKVTATK